MGRSHPSRSSKASASQPVTAKELEETENDADFESKISERVLRGSPRKSGRNCKSENEGSGKNDSKRSTRTTKSESEASSPKSGSKSVRKNAKSETEVEVEDDESNRDFKEQSLSLSKSKVGNCTTENEEEDEDHGMNILGTMSSEDVQMLLERLEKQCPKDDRVRIRIRTERIDWDQIAFANYGPKECRAVWTFMLENARKYRITREIVAEFQIAVTKNKKFLSSFNKCPARPKTATGGFQYYIRELWDTHVKECSQSGVPQINWCQFQKIGCNSYKTLTDKEKARYDKFSAKVNEEYQERVQEFYDKFPGLQKKKERKKGTVVKYKKSTVNMELLYPDAPKQPQIPQGFFIQSKWQKLETPPTEEELPVIKAKLSEKFLNLSDRKKSKWVDYTINFCENYTKELEEYQAIHPEYRPKRREMKFIIKKAEITLWEKYRDKPPRPKNSVFAMFIDDFCQKEENADIPADEIRRESETAFKELDWYHKEMYKMNYKMSSMQYRRDIKTYFENLPDVVKPLVLETIPRKYRPALVAVGKFPPVNDVTDDENFGDKEDVAEDGDEESYPTKKSKKRKHVEKLITPANTTIVEDNDSEEIVSDVSISNKKKKKRKHEDENSLSLLRSNEVTEEPALITGDVDDDDDHVKLEDPFSTELEIIQRQTSSPRRIVKNLKPDSPEKPVLSKHKVPQKPPVAKFTPQKLGQKDIDDAIRGIYDGRPRFGRRYSVYYYYAKYVVQDRVWLNYIDTFGILETADRIVSTFLELSDKQKEVFIAQSYNFYLQKQFGVKFIGAEKTYDPDEPVGLFPGEPKLPPRTAYALYAKEVELLKRRNIAIDFPKWDDLHVDTQMIFVKKLYRETQLYMKKFEEFVMDMSPNDMIEYTVFRAKLWERTYLKEHTASSSAKGFIFPLPRNEMNGEGYESGPQVFERLPGVTSGIELVKKKFIKEKLNPFYVGDLQKRGPKPKKPVEGETVDIESDGVACISSGEEEARPTLQEYTRDTTNKYITEIKDFFFPMGVLTKSTVPLKIRKKIPIYERERMRKATVALAAGQKAIKNCKKQALKIKRAKTRGGVKNKKDQLKVLLPKRRNYDNKKGDGERSNLIRNEDRESNNEDSGNIENRTSFQLDDDVDCSEFVSSLQSPKHIATLTPVEGLERTEHDIQEYQEAWGFADDIHYEGGEEQLLNEEEMLEPFQVHAEHDAENLEESYGATAPVFDIAEL